VATRLDVPAGGASAELAIPADARGPCHVRVFIEGSAACAAAGADLRIEPPARAASN
jgi:hypothetical protein